jgi:hypothetical protein
MWKYICIISLRHDITVILLKTNLSQVTDKHYHIMLLSSVSIDWYLTPTLAVLQLYRGVN